MNRIKLLREERGMSLNDLRDALLKKEGIKLSRASLNNYERGEQTPKNDTWKVLSDFFKVDIQYLMGLSPVRNSFENRSYERSLSNLVDLVESNGENVTTIRNLVFLFSIILRHIEKNELLTNEFHELLSSISNLTGDADFVTFDRDGNYLDNKEILRVILNEKNKIEKSISSFVDASIENVPSRSAIEINAASLFMDKSEQDEYFGENLGNYDFDEFMKDEQRREILKEKLEQRIKDNLRKIKKTD